LSDGQIDTIRRWIAEGALKDSADTPSIKLTLPRTQMEPARTLRISCRVRTASYLTLAVRDVRNGRLLFGEVASVKSPKNRGDAGEPGQLISWDVNAGTGWPASVDLELTIEHFTEEPRGTEFFARAVER